MAGEIKCRECDVPVITGNLASINLNVRPRLRGGNFLCIVCLEKMKPTNTTFQRWITEYVAAQKDPVALMREKVRDLQERLELANKTIANLERAQSRRVVN